MTESTNLRGWTSFVACYVLWLIFILLIGWVAGQAHSLLLELSLSLRFNPWVARAVRQLSLPLLGLAWLVCIFWLEYYFRTGSRTNRLMVRTARVAVITVGAYLTIVILRLLVPS